MNEWVRVPSTMMTMLPNREYEGNFCQSSAIERIEVGHATVHTNSDKTGFLVQE